uniref:P2X purinoceptor 7-like n=1 Tax=Ciona intestinalis TaxID=7719 RepID=UPI000EF48282|nr:P2X purinoceptor 7-like [Ciona intestinalis]|eukprot:XP_026695475.1 P2X purinoceptor 7-like [Ciona intestinalis]
MFHKAVLFQYELEVTACHRWCSCGKCAIMPTEEESICCHEIDILMENLQSVFKTYNDCVTDLEDFLAHINRAVLKTFFLSNRKKWKKNNKPKGENGDLSNEQFRFVAYRHILEWILKEEPLGSGNRMILPSCMVMTVRSMYSSNDGSYTGFKWPDFSQKNVFLIKRNYQSQF